VSPPWEGLWSRNDVRVKFVASTPLPSAGVAQTYYAVDSICTPLSPGIPYVGPVKWTTDGIQTVCYLIANNAGQFEDRWRTMEHRKRLPNRL
jgi:hypothetical protein